MNQTIVTLKKGEGRSFKAGGLWIYDNEIEKIEGTFKNGAIVTVHDNNGYPLGRGFINQNSKIRVRMMTRDASQEIDEAFLEEHGLTDLMKVVRGVPALSTPYVPRNSLIREFVGGSIFDY